MKSTNWILSSVLLLSLVTLLPPAVIPSVTTKQPIEAIPVKQIKSQPAMVVKPKQDKPIAKPAKKVENEPRYSPFNAVEIANADAKAVAGLKDPKLNIQYIRYLSLHNYPKSRRKTIKAIADKVVNELNVRYRPIIRTAALPALIDDPIIIRINLNDYGIDPKAWDDLVEKGSGNVPIPDPYFHIRLTKELPIFPSKTEEIVEVQSELTTNIINAGESGRGTIEIEAPLDARVFVSTIELPVTEKRIFLTQPLNAGESVNYDIRINLKDKTLTGKIQAQAGKTTQVKINNKRNVIQKKEEKQQDKKKEIILASAPWLALELDKDSRGETISNLISLTNTKNPIVRADWFIVYSTLAPAYYRLIGLQLKPNPNAEDAKKNPQVFLEKDFEKLFKFDKQAAEEDVVAAITDTKIVTLHNRILLRFSTVRGVTGGYYWKSQDTDQGIDDEDYLNQIVVFNKPKIKAQEIIASGRNGMNFYALTDANNVLLNAAATTIAQQGDVMPTKLQDKTVFAGRNCMFCHATGQLVPKDKVRNIARNKIGLLIADKTKDQEVARAIEEAFSPNPKSIVDSDNARFVAAVIASCGKDARTIARDFEELIYEYYDQSLTLEKIAWEVGLETNRLRVMLQEGVNIDYTLTALLQIPPEEISRLPWERQGFTELMRYLIGYTPRQRSP